MLILTPAAAPPEVALWLDLLDPTEAERAQASAATGLRVPSRAELAEVETSSRLYAEGDALFCSMPASYRGDGPLTQASPLGFVLSPDRLLTIRFMKQPAFDTVHAKLAAAVPGATPADPLEMLVGLWEAMVDRLADVLEATGADLDRVSVDVFGDCVERSHAASRAVVLRDTLRQLGQLGDRLSRIRDSLQGLARIVPFVGDRRDAGASVHVRIETIKQDIASLRDYDQQLASKVSFLLDATLGLIGMQQNDVFRVLTIVSVIGIPPTLVAGIYGMNFKNMPEYGWTYGYQYGWAMLILSALVPLVWFRVKGWL